MTLSYKHCDKRINVFTPIVEDYVAWFSQALDILMYQGKRSQKDPIFPGSFSVWLSKGDLRHSGSVSRLVEAHDHLKNLTDSGFASVQHKREPLSQEEFLNFSDAFNAFIQAFRVVEKEMVVEESGLDVPTGLRNLKLLAVDFSREMERLSRGGKPFSIVLVRIDNFEAIRMECGLDQAEIFAGLTAAFIQRSVRSFDDAYAGAPGEFVLCLKQADVSGGIKALERLKSLLEQSGLSYEIKGRKHPLTISSCIVEPIPGDDIEELLSNLKEELDESTKELGTTLQYFEISPLEKFAGQYKSDPENTERF